VVQALTLVGLLQEQLDIFVVNKLLSNQ